MEYQEAISRLEALRYSRDLNAFEKTVDTLMNELSPGSEKYFNFLLHACDLLSSLDFGDYPRQTRLIHQYANTALSSPAPIPLETNLQLLQHTEQDFEEADIETVREEAWASKRRAHVTRWLESLRQLEERSIKDFDFSDVPQINIIPPGGNFPAGIAPQDVQDPAIRREYEEEIARNQQKAATFAEQWRLRELRNEYFPRALHYIARASARPPLNQAELEHMLNQHLSDENMKQEILNAAHQEIARQQL